MYDADENDYIIIDGEQINSWVIVDEEGTVVDPCSLDDGELIEAYEECQKWGEPV
jgi:hypothetical protein